MSLKQKLIDCIPDAFYEDGTQATCISFRIFNMFDIDSHSFKQVKENKIMEKIDIPNDGTLKCDKIIIGDKYEISVADGNLRIDEKK